MGCRTLTVAGLVLVTSAVLPLPLVAGEETLAQRRVRLEQMSDAEKTRLLDNKERFDELLPDERKRIQRLHQQLVHDPQYDRLRVTLQNYSDWLKTLTIDERNELAKLPASERLQKVKELMELQATVRLREMIRDELKSAELLSEVDLKEIRQWTDHFLREHAREILDSLPDTPFFADLKTISNPQEHFARLRFLYAFPQFSKFRPPQRNFQSPSGLPSGKEGPQAKTGRRPGVDLGIDAMSDRGPDWLPRPTSEEEDELAKRVSLQARSVLDKATEGDERSRIIQNWMRVAAMSHFRPPVNRQQMISFALADLSKKQLERLGSMPRELMFGELSKMLARQANSRGRWRMGPPGVRRDGDGFSYPGGRGGRDRRSREKGGPRFDGGRRPRGERDGDQNKEPGRSLKPEA